MWVEEAKLSSEKMNIKGSKIQKPEANNLDQK